MELLAINFYQFYFVTVNFFSFREEAGNSANKFMYLVRFQKFLI